MAHGRNHNFLFSVLFSTQAECRARLERYLYLILAQATCRANVEQTFLALFLTANSAKKFSRAQWPKPPLKSAKKYNTSLLVRVIKSSWHTNKIRLRKPNKCLLNKFVHMLYSSTSCWLHATYTTALTTLRNYCNKPSTVIHYIASYTLS